MYLTVYYYCLNKHLDTLKGLLKERVVKWLLKPPRECGLRGSQGMGVVSNNWFDCGLLPILYALKPSD